MSYHLFIVILLCSLVSFFLRAVPLMAFANRNFSPLIQTWLGFIPSTIIAAIIASEVVQHFQNKAEAISMIVATVISFVICYVSRSLFLTVIVGMGVYFTIWLFL